MAVITSSSIVADISGKVGDVVYSRNRQGAYVKSFAAPIQPNSAKQIAHRALFSNAISAWDSLSDAEYTAYVAFSENHQKQTFTGSCKNVDPKGFFIANSINRQYVGESATPLPVMPYPSGFNSLSVDNTNGIDYYFTLNGGSIDANFATIFSTSHPRNPSVRSLNSTQRIRFSFNSYTPGVPVNLREAFDTNFPLEWLFSENRLFGSVIVIHKNSGIKVGFGWDSSLMDLPSVPDTLGNTFIGSSQTGISKTEAIPVLSIGEGFINSIAIYNSNVPSNITLGVYSDSAGDPDVLLAATAPFLSNPIAEWRTEPLLLPLAITKNQPLWIAFVNDAIRAFKYNSVIGAARQTLANFPPLPDPFGAHTTINNDFSLYANCVYS